MNQELNVRGFTLDEMAAAMRGVPRDARIMIRLPDGQLVDIDHIKAAHVPDGGTARAAGASTTGTRYGIILVPKTA